MKRSLVNTIIFWSAAIIATLLYCLSAPSGLPWNESSHLAMAYLNEIARLPAMPHSFWGFYVQVFGGSVALAIGVTALAAGLLGALVGRYLGWRFGASAALIWMFMPGVWNRAITGERGVCLASMLVIAIWLLNAIGLWVLRKAKAARLADTSTATLGAHDVEAKRGKINYIASWGALLAAVLFAIVSLSIHDYQLGEAASVFARGIVDAAEGRIIVLNGVCDDQIVMLTKGKTAEEGFEEWVPWVSMRNDDANRSNVISWVKKSFPAETNLWVAAQVSPSAMVDSAIKRRPEWFYVMNGSMTTYANWESRWNVFKPYLESSDPFVSVARRMFGREGNAVANAICDGKEKVEGDAQQFAWQLYNRIYNEIDPENISALINQSEMIRRGYEVGKSESQKVKDNIEKFFKLPHHREHARQFVQMSGPVRTDPAMVEKMAEETRKRIAAKIAAGEKVEYSPEYLTLIEWNNEMIEFMNKGEIDKAGRVARAILTNSKWHGFIPANAIMGSVASKDGDYVASAEFFRVATDTTNKVPESVLNDYADTLMHLGRLDEAEKYARRSVTESNGKFWVGQITLAEVLARKAKSITDEEQRSKCRAEVKDLFRAALSSSPIEAHERIRKLQRENIR